jgi:hypothetical protein
MVMVMVCGSRNDTIVTKSRRSSTAVDLTCQHKNHTVLVEGPEIMIRPVGTRRVVPAGCCCKGGVRVRWSPLPVARPLP